MKLYLSSYLLGDHADRLIAMAGRGARMAVITNALDAIDIEARLKCTRTTFDPVAYFAGSGFDASLVDLRYYFGRPESLRDLLRRHRIVWALGGNAFLLRRAMRESGFDRFVTDMLREDRMVYGGFSAGACVAGSSLRGIDLMDEPLASAAGYSSNEVVWEGLNLVPFTIVPHYKSEHPEARAAAEAVGYLEAHAISYQALHDGDVVVKDGDGTTVLRKVAD
jgi:dipeptidase E